MFYIRVNAMGNTRKYSTKIENNLQFAERHSQNTENHTQKGHKCVNT